MATNNAINSAIPIEVPQGGTGVATLTDHGILLGSATAALTPMSVGATGEILTGVSTADPTWLAAGDAGKVLTANGAGSAVTWETAPGSATLSINNQTASYVLALTDNGKMVTMTVEGANTVTIPKHSVVAFPIGAQILIYQGGAGVTTIIPVDGDVTINSAGSYVALFAQYSVCSLVQIAENVWSLMGDLG
jgi:hypothetical protein